ncbi:MAG: hypothetical protein JOZ58_18410 [Acetobacteraceae bacterium]|nr:hypothetical protein [Acetobacteraceae bacterium]
MNRPRRSFRISGLLLLVVAAFAESCAPKPPPRPPARQYAVDQTGAAKSCTVPKVTPEDGKETPVPVTVVNDGGWCAISVGLPPAPNDVYPTPYKAGLLTSRPAHGKVYIHTVGDATRIDYTPAPGYAGPDSFAVTLIPGDAVLRVAATVTK